MKVSEAFLVNTKNFESIVETLANYHAEDITINSDLLERLSYSDPNDLLVIRILKDFSIIDNDGKPSKYFEEFQHPETTKVALAKGLLNAYEGIFAQHPNIHQRSLKEIKEVFDAHFKGNKTDLIIKYISGTFEKIVSFVGPSTIDKVLTTNADEEYKSETVMAENSQLTSNGSKNDSVEKDNTFISPEEISDNNIDDFLNYFEESDSDEQENSKIEDEESQTTDNSSIQEFANSSEDSPLNMTKNGKDEITQQNDTETTSDQHNENSEEDNIFDFEDDEQLPTDNKSASTSADDENNTDIDPTDLEVPMSEATKPTSSMPNLSKEHQFVQKALIRKSDLLHKMKRWEELIPTLEDIINRYDNKQTDFKEAVERAIIRRAIALLKLGKNDEALSALTTVINRFKDSENTEFYEQASRAMLYKVNILENKNASSDELLPLYNTVIDRMDTSSDKMLQEKLNLIHCKRFDLLINEKEDAIVLDASKKLIKRFKDSENHQDYLQKAMIIRAETLDNMGEDEAALQAYDEFLNRFGNL
ncbi:DUF5343 domain-containing protein [Fodinibius sp. Rm-B-1B1-1]|uniref:DUF5343 domain-containing protein n=1 Tax=Fodinibius alkaliphilus TaxID=3140241 RepID=UPI00315A9EE1